MNKVLLAALIAASLVSTQVSAETTVGIGIGSLYNGFGMNIGKLSQTSLTFVSLGCMAFSDSTSTSESSEGFEKTHGYNTNCGGGIGYVSTAVMPGQRQGVGLSAVVTRNNFKGIDGSKVELVLMPSYYYFFKGINQSGLNMGIGAGFAFSENVSVEPGLTLNIGYQF